MKYSLDRMGLDEVNVADLLERNVAPPQSAASYILLKKKVILVTGAAGSIGSELCRQLLDRQPALVVALDTNETGLFDLAESLRSHPCISRLYLRIGDITDIQRMERLFTKLHFDIVFHVAAYKHVPLLEEHADQAIRTNVLATYHLCNLAIKYEVERFIFISTDKAANPTSVLGASKKFGEIVVQGLAKSALQRTSFCAVRFGNVIGSRGSVVSVFARQIKEGGPVTVTDPEATRYFMTIPEACGLTILSAAMAESGTLCLLDMGKPVRILDLAVKMINAYSLQAGQDIAIVYTGLRPGECLHEMLTAPGEELLPTAHSKIFLVVSKENVPTLTTIAERVQALNDNLLHESNEQLRERLFDLIKQPDLIFAH